ncbi:ACR119Wp [Eremothecium gossypii ATCC 10895]|uniref:non-specific serine/threonine protein kinase n=1 Tax=Eremothecium gossypii (strain ATCC 10895 / CBS 109.51 / FGSC 9923 / NRRL Y-1056) TaxID=284811 RepID=Q75C00_EREGS|nr:ACR119Wp [Eremothecium gossypii ATCC 10895]AAS51345.2 ACR119Wp [Eremothecium gossypii ATCC 10895]AEY95637.1 FACR119Wp [Eremothecium gossypii FDAG1]
MTSIPHRHTYYGGGATPPAATGPLSGSRGHAAGRSKKKQVTFGPYIIGPTLGEGEFGKVKLGWSKARLDGDSRNVAIKLIRRDTVPKNSEKEIKIYRELNALKLLSHPNIVRLEEVLQNSKYIGIVLQYASGGEFYKYIQKKRRLKEPPACRLFAQLISGVHYIHYKGLAHRDLKLENLLLDEHENLIITDFGFVNEFHKNDLMRTSCGSPCYAAPELVVSSKPYSAQKADVWSCGVILYAMLAGYLPWDDDPENPEGDDIAKLYQYITHTSLKFPEYIKPIPRDLLRRILVSNPEVRLTVADIEQHAWLQPHAQFLMWSPSDWDAKAKAETNNLFRQPSAVHAGVLRPQSSCSISSANSKGDNRGSLIMDSTLNPQPVPPQEFQSHIIMKPTSPSNGLRKMSPVRRHARSNSAASIALQAVVDAERDYFNSPSIHSLHHDSLSQNTTPPSSAGRVPTYAITRSATHHNGISSSLMNRNSVIIEVSPQKGSVPPVMIPGNRESLNGQESGGIAMADMSQRPTIVKDKTSSHMVPQAGRKQRPTSYQPCSTTAFAQSPDLVSGAGALVPIMGKQQRVSTASNPTFVDVGRSGSTRRLPGPNNQLLETPFEADRQIDDNPVVDDATIKSDDMLPSTLEIVAYDNECGTSPGSNGQHRRYSAIVMSEIYEQEEGERISCELSSPKKMGSARPDCSTARISINTPNMGLQNRECIVSSSSPESDASSKQKSGKTDKKDKRFSLLSFYSFYNNSKSSIDSSTDAVQPTGLVLDVVKHPNISRTSSQKKNPAPAGNGTQAIPRRHNTLPREAQRTPVALSYVYASLDVTPNAGTPELADVPSPINLVKMAEQPHGTKQHDPSTPTRSATVHGKSQRLSNNTPKGPIYEDPKPKRKTNKVSLMVSSINPSQAPQPPRQKEPSTARKVLDFFKRRSLRI